MRHRRYQRIPQAILDELTRLLRETDLSAERCIQTLNLGHGSRVWKIVKKQRRYVARGIWVDRTTGKLRPENVCTTTCIAEKVGVSTRTIRRRIKDGAIRPKYLKSDKSVSRFNEQDVRKLIEIGKNPGDKHGVVTRADVRAIRRRAKREIHETIAKDYGISRRQVSRIVNREQWKNVK